MPSATSLVELLRHPLRWRITQLFVGRTLTTGQLAGLLPEVPTTTLYRQVKVLVDAGVLVVAAEHQVRGTTERSYALNSETAPGQEPVGPGLLRSMFTVFVTGLASDLDKYLDRDAVDPVVDGVAFRQVALQLSDEEFEQFAEALGEFLAPYAAAEPNAQRTRRLLSLALIPD